MKKILEKRIYINFISKKEKKINGENKELLIETNIKINFIYKENPFVIKHKKVKTIEERDNIKFPKIGNKIFVKKLDKYYVYGNPKPNIYKWVFLRKNYGLKMKISSPKKTLEKKIITLQIGRKKIYEESFKLLSLKNYKEEFSFSINLISFNKYEMQKLKVANSTNIKIKDIISVVMNKIKNRNLVYFLNLYKIEKIIKRISELNIETVKQLKKEPLKNIILILKNKEQFKNIDIFAR